MEIHGLHGISLLFFLIYGAFSSYIVQIGIEDPIFTIPGNNCKPIATAYKTILNYSLLKKICTNIESKQKLMIEMNFEDLETDLFENMPQIKSVNASNLNFTEINLSSSNLRTIDFSKNKLRKFRLLIRRNLKILNLSHNKLMDIELIPEQKKTLNLEILDVSHNILRNIDFVSLLQKLKDLNLSWNQIGVIPANTFFKLKYLIALKLSHNKLSSLSPCLLCSLENLRVLDLSHNNIATIEFLAVPSMKHLEIVDLNMNGIGDLSHEGLIENYPNLRTMRTTHFFLNCGDFSGNFDEDKCFYAPCASRICCLALKNKITRRSISHSHFHTIINDKKMSHNVSAIVPPKNKGKTKDMNPFEGTKNVENNIMQKMYYNMTIISSKLVDLNDTLSDMVLEISSMDSEINKITPKTSLIEKEYEDVIFLLKFFLCLLMFLLLLNVFSILDRIRRSRSSKKYRMNLLNLENVEHR